jgi:hypothetical protein
MKHFLLAALYALLVASQAFAQNQSIPDQLAFRYGPLDKSQLSTGYLWDLTLPLVSPYRYCYGPTNDNYIDTDIFGMLYAELQGAKTPDAAALPNAATFLDLKKSTAGTQEVPLAMLPAASYAPVVHFPSTGDAHTAFSGLDDSPERAVYPSGGHRPPDTCHRIGISPERAV